MTADVPLPADLLAAAEARRPGFLADLTTLCAIDSGSHDAAGVNAIADWCENRLVAGGFTVERVSPGDDVPALGDLLVGRRPGRRPQGKRLLLLAHMDTVYDAGTARARPVVERAGRLLGPGVTDDKGGLLTGINAVELLVEAGHDDWAEVVVACSPDEELGSPFSRPHLERLARQADAGFCLECARENGDIVSQRKGIADLAITVTGRAAHAGVEPERGRSAALEAAHQTIALHALNGRWPGVTVNVGVVRAGTRPNVVAEQAVLEVDVRATTRAALDEALAAVEAIAATPTVDGVTARVEQRAGHVPMERTPAIAALVAEAQAVARGLGFEVADAATGGAADANTVAAVGLPVLDGLGPVGGDDHSPAEWLDPASIVPRMALLAGLLQRVGAGE